MSLFAIVAAFEGYRLRAKQKGAHRKSLRYDIRDRFGYQHGEESVSHQARV